VIRNDQEREELLKYAEILAKDTQSTTTATTTVKSWAEDDTIKNTHYLII